MVLYLLQMGLFQIIDPKRPEHGYMLMSHTKKHTKKMVVSRHTEYRVQPIRGRRWGNSIISMIKIPFCVEITIDIVQTYHVFLQ